MNFLLAAYDPSQSTAYGDYWVWSHENLTFVLKSKFYYEVAAKALPKDQQTLLSSECYAGWAAINELWACVYQVVDAGRDLRGRPGRFRLVCAFYKRADDDGFDIYDALRSEPFRGLVELARHSGPVPAPVDLNLQVELSRFRQFAKDSGQSLDQKNVLYEGDLATNQVAFALSKMPPSTTFRSILTVNNGQEKIKLQIDDLPISSPPQIEIKFPAKDRGAKTLEWRKPHMHLKEAMFGQNHSTRIG